MKWATNIEIFGYFSTEILSWSMKKSLFVVDVVDVITSKKSGLDICLTQFFWLIYLMKQKLMYITKMQIQM